MSVVTWAEYISGKVGRHTWSGGSSFLAFPPAAGVDGVLVVIAVFFRTVNLRSILAISIWWVQK